MTDPFVGQLTFFRVYSGVLTAGSSASTTPTKQRTERIGRLLKMHANKREEIKEVYAGDIAAAVGLKSVSTGDTLCDEKHPIVLESMDFPKPVISLAIEPKTKVGPGEARRRPAEADGRGSDVPRARPTSRPARSIIAGMGELHLEIIVDRLKREFSVEATRRQAAGRLQGNADASGRRRDEVRQADRRPRPVRPREDPSLSRRAGHRLHLRERDHAAARFRRNSSSRSTKASRKRSRAASSPAIRSTTCGSSCTTARTHDVDSSEMAFKIAGSMAFQDAAKKARPVLLEPIMRVEVVVPEGTHGRRDGQPRRAGAARFSRRKTAAARRSSTRGCRCRRCSATRPTSGRARRAARPTRCTSIATSRRRRT